MKVPSIRSLLLSAAVGLTLIAQTRPAMSDLLRWNLQNVLFTDGATASGFFSLDATQTSGSLADFDIKVTGGKYPSFEYTPREGISGSWGPLGSPSQNQKVGAVFSTSSGPVRSLQLVPALNQPGTYPLNSVSNTYNFDAGAPFYTQSFEQLGNPLADPTNPAPRWLRTGSLTTGTPQPSSHGR
jgi:hypothetical protein